MDFLCRASDDTPGVNTISYILHLQMTSNVSERNEFGFAADFHDSFSPHELNYQIQVGRVVLQLKAVS